MNITAHLNIDLVALDTADDLTCLVDLRAPLLEQVAARPGQSLVIVLDRSGSMSGEPLEGAKESIRALIHRLAPQDAFGLVVFDEVADVAIPVRLMGDHDVPTLEAMVGRIGSGGSTDLSAGYLLGLRELKRSLRSTNHPGGTVLLVSDGHANAGITDPVRMRDLAGQAFGKHAVTTSTLGYGQGYDEVLLEAITRGGNGTHAFAPDVDSAMKEIQEAVTDLLDKSVVAALMRIRPRADLVEGIRVLQDLPHWAEGDGVVVNLGDLYAGEERKTLFALHIPGIPTLGLVTVAEVVFEYTTLPDLLEHEVVVPLSVNIVPGDQARGRVPNPVVEVEQLMVDIDTQKRDIASSLRAGDSRTAQRTLASAITDLNAKREQVKKSGITGSLQERLDEAARDLLNLAGDVRDRDANFAGKSMMNSYAASSRGRKLKAQSNWPSDADQQQDEDADGTQ